MMQPSNPTATGGGAWAVLLPRGSALAAGALRLRTDVEVCDTGDGVWLRGAALTDDLDRELRKLPGGRRFEVGPGGRLTPRGGRVPSGRLPESSWQPLSAWLVPDPQPAALSGQTGQRVALRIVRSDREQAATVLVTDLAAWTAYATAAPAVRLRPLRFAAAADGRVVVRGEPLPPIPGRRYVEREGVAVPAGFEWSPAVEAAVVRELLGLGTGDLALVGEDGGYERIDAGHFVRATRSAARATAQPSAS